MVERKQFRADLYYRLFVFPIVLPPLRERPDDIPVLASHLLRKLAEDLGRPAPTLADDALRGLARYRFPGNVRELGNILERALVRCRYAVIDLQYLDLGIHEPRVQRGGAGAHRARAAARAALPARRACRSISARWSGWRFKRRCAGRTATARTPRACWGSACARCATSCASIASAAGAAPAGAPAAASADGQILPDEGADEGRRPGRSSTDAAAPVDEPHGCARSSARDSHLVPAHKEQAA